MAKKVAQTWKIIFPPFFLFVYTIRQPKIIVAKPNLKKLRKKIRFLLLTFWVINYYSAYNRCYCQKCIQKWSIDIVHLTAVNFNGMWKKIMNFTVHTNIGNWNTILLKQKFSYALVHSSMNVFHCNIACKSCLLQFVHTKSIAALAQFWYFPFENKYDTSFQLGNFWYSQQT